MFSLSEKMDFQIPCFPCDVATLYKSYSLNESIICFPWISTVYAWSTDLLSVSCLGFLNTMNKSDCISLHQDQFNK